MTSSKKHIWTVLHVAARRGVALVTMLGILAPAPAMAVHIHAEDEIASVASSGGSSSHSERFLQNAVAPAAAANDMPSPPVSPRSVSPRSVSPRPISPMSISPRPISPMSEPPAAPVHIGREDINEAGLRAFLTEVSETDLFGFYGSGLKFHLLNVFGPNLRHISLNLRGHDAIDQIERTSLVLTHLRTMDLTLGYVNSYILDNVLSQLPEQMQRVVLHADEMGDYVHGPDFMTHPRARLLDFSEILGPGVTRSLHHIAYLHQAIQRAQVNSTSACWYVRMWALGALPQLQEAYQQKRTSYEAQYFWRHNVSNPAEIMPLLSPVWWDRLREFVHGYVVPEVDSLFRAPGEASVQAVPDGSEDADLFEGVESGFDLDLRALRIAALNLRELTQILSPEGLERLAANPFLSMMRSPVIQLQPQRWALDFSGLIQRHSPVAASQPASPALSDARTDSAPSDVDSSLWDGVPSHVPDSHAEDIAALAELPGGVLDASDAGEVSDVPAALNAEALQQSAVDVIAGVRDWMGQVVVDHSDATSHSDASDASDVMVEIRDDLPLGADFSNHMYGLVGDSVAALRAVMVPVRPSSVQSVASQDSVENLQVAPVRAASAVSQGSVGSLQSQGPVAPVRAPSLQSVAVQSVRPASARSVDSVLSQQPAVERPASVQSVASRSLSPASSRPVDTFADLEAGRFNANYAAWNPSFVPSLHKMVPDDSVIRILEVTVREPRMMMELGTLLKEHFRGLQKLILTYNALMDELFESVPNPLERLMTCVTPGCQAVEFKGAEGRGLSRYRIAQILDLVNQAPVAIRFGRNIWSNKLPMPQALEQNLDVLTLLNQDWRVLPSMDASRHDIKRRSDENVSRFRAIYGWLDRLSELQAARPTLWLEFLEWVDQQNLREPFLSSIAAARGRGRASSVASSAHSVASVRSQEPQPGGYARAIFDQVRAAHVRAGGHAEDFDPIQHIIQGPEADILEGIRAFMRANAAFSIDLAPPAAELLDRYLEQVGVEVDLPGYQGDAAVAQPEGDAFVPVNVVIAHGDIERHALSEASDGSEASSGISTPRSGRGTPVEAVDPPAPYAVQGGFGGVAAGLARDDGADSASEADDGASSGADDAHAVEMNAFVDRAARFQGGDPWADRGL